MKTTFFKIFVIAFISANIALVAAAAMPQGVSKRIVDKIMDSGDRYVGGPFKKGGGDEAATRKVIEHIISPGNPWRAALDISTEGESSTATTEQDKPGYSQAHGVPMPSGAKVQNANDQAGRSDVSPANQNSITINPEIHPETSGIATTHNPEHQSGPSGQDHNATSAPEPSTAVATPGGHVGGSTADAPTRPGQQELRAGETTSVQSHPGEVEYHPNREAATGGNTAQPAASAPAQPAASAPARDPGRGPDRSDPTHGMERIDRGHDFDHEKVSEAGHTT
jgi:hypothetical protein